LTQISQLKLRTQQKKTTIEIAGYDMDGRYHEDGIHLLLSALNYRMAKKSE